MSDDRVPPWVDDPTPDSNEDWWVENPDEVPTFPTQSESVFGDVPDVEQPPTPAPVLKGVPSRAIIEDDHVAIREPSGKPRRGLKKHRGLKVTTSIIVAIVLVIAGGVTYAWFDLNGKLNNQDVGPILGSSRPPSFSPTTPPAVKYPGDPFAGRPVNILVMGTDSREGSNAGVSGDDPGGARSDTTFIAHVSADRTRVDVVSIPRDTWITIPDCTTEDGEIIEEAGWMRMGFNAAFAYGVESGGSIATGAACSIRAVEEMSNVRIDAYVVVDFMGFVDVVNAIGGLDVTLLCPITSRNAGGLDLPEGEVHLDGVTAVNLARARTGDGLGDGSDLQRIERQHLLFNAVVDKVFAMNYVTDFPKLYGLVGAVIGSLTTDMGSNIAEIAGFGFSLKGLNTANINFATIPIGSAGNGVNVVILKSQAEPLWEALRTDQPLPSDDADPTSDGQTPTPEESTEATAPDPGTGEVAPPTAPAGPPVVQRPSDC